MVEKTYKCVKCSEQRPKEDFKWYNRWSRGDNCIDCRSKPYRKGNVSFEEWYNENKDTKEIIDFLDNLRRVTGVYSTDDLIKKHKKY